MKLQEAAPQSPRSRPRLESNSVARTAAFTALAVSAALTVPMSRRAEATNPREPRPVISVHDLGEINNYYDADGNAVYDQVIFWDRDKETGELEVTDWRLIPTAEQTVTEGIGKQARKYRDLVPTIEGQAMIPKRDKLGNYTSAWTDKGYSPQQCFIPGPPVETTSVERETRFRKVQTTHTQYDPELVRRPIVAHEKRKLLPAELPLLERKQHRPQHR